MTNRELYQEIEDIVQRHTPAGRTLEKYSSTLLILARQQSNLDSVPVADFVRLLSDAFTAEPLSFDEGWRTQLLPLAPDVLGFGGWEQDKSTGQAPVQGQVAVLDAGDRIVSSNPEEIDDLVVEIPEVSWELFRQFVECGQQYE